MLEGIEALIALEKTGTVSEAAARLRLTQSAVSKRIRALEERLGFRLIEPDGRRVRITGKGQLFLAKAKPLVAEFENLGRVGEPLAHRSFSIGIADSIASSWGPVLLRKAMRRMKGLQLDLHVHRSTLVHEFVRLGRYQMGLCPAFSAEPGLLFEKLAEEPLVLVNSEFKERPTAGAKVISIEKSSATWKAISSRLSAHPRLSVADFMHVESFSAAIQMAQAGFGHALVPAGLARAMKVPEQALQKPSPRIWRDIHLIHRKHLSDLPHFIEFRDHLMSLASNESGLKFTLSI